MAEPLLTVVILTKNEEERIERCLRSLQFQARVLIFDSFSTDGTWQRAQKTWAEMKRPPEDLILVTHLWQGFVKARNRSRDWVSTPWLLWVDADEWLSEELLLELKELKPGKIYKIPRQSYFMGRAIRHSGWFPDKKARLAEPQSSIWKEGPYGSDVHEDLYALEGDAQYAPLQGFIFHEPFRSREEHEETNRNYSRLMAETMALVYKKKGKNPPSWPYIYVRSLFKFVENYFWKLGILDFVPGLIICWASAKSMFFRYKTLRKLLVEGS